MRRFLLFWLVLAPTLLVASWAARFLGFGGHVDLRRDSLGAALLTPCVQAVLLVWLTADPGRPGFVRFLRRSLARPTVLGLLLVDLLLLGVAWAVPEHSLLGIHTSSGLLVRVTGVQALGAAILLVWRATRGGQTRLDRALSAFLAAALAGVGIDRFRPWISTLPQRPPFASWPGPLGWLLLWALPFALLLTAAVAVSSRMRRRGFALAAGHLDAAAGFAFAAATTLALSGYSWAWLTEPWGSLARSLVFLSVACGLTAAVLADQPDAGEGRP